LYTEKLCHLSNTLSYSPPEQAPEISPLPALKNGFVTFGSFNNLKKVNEHVLQLWARILMSVEDSRLLFLGCDAAVERQRLVDGLGRLGISRERLEMLPTLPTTEFLQAMARADLALDPFPHVGGATTAHSLWMGVPVITLEGHCEFERISACLLRNAGHSEWVAPDAEAYKEIALKWSTDLAGLADLRLTLRERLSDRSGALIQDIEEIYTQIMACSDDQELGSMF
jgi:predicted O-linked N-acetylglucosamine transferase (SPINDLY family)